MNQNTYLILQVAADTDQALSNWADRLGNDRFYELGSDPRLIRGMEHELEQMIKKLEALSNPLRVARIPMRQMNAYFAVCGELQKATKLLGEIRRQEFGSMSNTAHFLRQLESCRLSFHEMVALLQPTPPPHTPLH